MDLEYEPVTKEEDEILSVGIPYMFAETRIAMYLREDIMPTKQESFSFIWCYLNSDGSNGIISVGNPKNQTFGVRAFDSKKKLFANYNWLKRTLSTNPILTLVWEGKLNDARLS